MLRDESDEVSSHLEIREDGNGVDQNRDAGCVGNAQIEFGERVELHLGFVEMRSANESGVKADGSGAVRVLDRFSGGLGARTGNQNLSWRSRLLRGFPKAINLVPVEQDGFARRAIENISSESNR